MSLEEDVALLREAGAYPVDGPSRDFTVFDEVEASEPHVMLPGRWNRALPITKAARLLRGDRLLVLLEQGEAARYAASAKIPKPPRVPADLLALVSDVA